MHHQFLARRLLRLASTPGPVNRMRCIMVRSSQREAHPLIDCVRILPSVSRGVGRCEYMDGRARRYCRPRLRFSVPWSPALWRDAGAELQPAAPCPAAAGPNTPLAIGQGNATATAAEAIVTPATLAETATTAAGASTGPAAVPPALSSIDRRVVQRWFSSQNVSPTAAGTVTIPCAVGGSFTAVTSVDGKTLTVTFADCSEVAGTSVGGTQTYTNLTLTTTSSSDSISANVADTLTIVVGALSFAETGDYAFAFSANKTAVGAVSTATFGLTGSSLSISVSKGGAVSDSSDPDQPSISLLRRI